MKKLLFLMIPFIILSTGCAKKPHDNWKIIKKGINYKIIRSGQGKTAANNSKVTIYYRGYLPNSRTFDTTNQPGRGPLTATLGSGQLFPGLNSSIIGMKVGEIRTTEISPNYSFQNKYLKTIPLNSKVYYDIELIKIR